MSRTVLLIDDDDSLRRVTEYNLSAKGYRVFTAPSGARGLEVFQEAGPDLVVSDVKLGDMNGLDLMEKIKAASPETPVIIMTAFGSIEMAVRAMHSGAFTGAVKALEMAGQNRSEAARLLKIPRHVLLYRIEKYGLDT